MRLLVNRQLGKALIPFRIVPLSQCDDDCLLAMILDGKVGRIDNPTEEFNPDAAGRFHARLRGAHDRGIFRSA